MSHSAYEKYLQSKSWKALRKSAFKMWGRACAVCGKNKHLQVHHIFYAWPWKNGKPEHLIPLCDRHHSAAEKMIGKGRTCDEDCVANMRAVIIDELRGIYRERKKEKSREKRKLAKEGLWLPPEKRKVLDYEEYQKRRPFVDPFSSENL